MDKIERGNPLTQSADIVKENLETLKRLFPTIVKEGKIDVDELKALIDDEVETSEEYYRFTWAGKSEARREANKPSTGTLRPNKADSKDWDTTGNIFIEGDNLEVLKLMQKSYAGKIKMMYFDPPYNTGKDFVYKDNYADNLGNYLAMSKQTDDEGNKLSTNTESDGRYHSNWLNMMYPRLKLARNLLTENGVVFISIDDNEVSNLKKLCDEIFGEENFIAKLIWNKQHSQQQGIFKKYHEYVLLYAKNIIVQNNISGGEGLIDAGALKKVSKGNPKSTFTFPAGVRFEAPDGFTLTGEFGDSEKVEVVSGRLIAKNKKTLEEVTLAAGWTQKEQMKLYFSGEKVIDTKGQIVLEFYFTSTGKLKCLKERSKITPPSILPLYGMVSEQTEKLSTLLNGYFFENPKPIDMIQDFCSWYTKDNDIILDIFSGSGTTAHSVLQLNAEDGGKRKFISLQIPEPTDVKSEAYKAGFRNIAEICKERIRRAGEKINSELNNDLCSANKDKLDIGFKAFKLDSSNINSWDGSVENFEANLFNAQNNIKDDRTEEDVLFEILLKYGLDLTVPIQEKAVGKCKLYSIGAGVLFICLSDNITTEVAKAIGEWKNELEPATCRVLFKDNGFIDDVAKTNSVQILRQYGIEECNSI